MSASWGERAAAYDALIRKHTILGELARRLVELVPREACEVLDVGGGTGLVSGLLLGRRPAPAVHLCDPAPEMVAIARERLGPQLASARVLGAEQVNEDATPVDAAVANACLHLSELPRSLPAIAARLRPGAALVFNLWWHSWEPTAGDQRDDPLWRTPLAEALQEAGHGPDLLPDPAPRSAPIAPTTLQQESDHAGMDLEVLGEDRNTMTASFLLEFAAMDPSLLAGLPGRERVLARAGELASGSTQVASTRFRLTRRR